MKPSLAVLATAVIGIACFSFSSRLDAASAPSRLVIVGRDITPSYCCLDQAEQRIEEVVSCLGPGDKFYLIDIGSSFNPENHVKVILNLPPVPGELLDQQTLSGLLDRSKRLNLVLAASEKRKAKILNYLGQPVAKDRRGTDIHGFLAYAAQLLANDPSEEKDLLLFTDLQHDLSGVRTDRPPSKRLSMPGIRAMVLFMPYDAKWAERQAAWSRFFDQSGASAVTLLDAAMSRTAPLLTRRTLPRAAALGQVQ
jgi:hypothetical protein